MPLLRLLHQLLALSKRLNFMVFLSGVMLRVGVLDIYGKNVVTTEGTDWRTHRKITARPFSEKNNQLVHEESVRQSIQMMADWESKSATPNTVVVEKSHFTLYMN